jgi:hypothetical protein
MEWFYRFLKEPRRLFRRYFIDDVTFFYYFIKQLLGVYKNPFSLDKEILDNVNIRDSHNQSNL